MKRGRAKTVLRAVAAAAVVAAATAAAVVEAATVAVVEDVAVVVVATVAEEEDVAAVVEAAARVAVAAVVENAAVATKRQKILQRGPEFTPGRVCFLSGRRLAQRAAFWKKGNQLFFGVGVAAGAGAALGFGAAGRSGGVVFGGVPKTRTGVPTSAMLKKSAAFAGGMRTQPCEAGQPGR